jgi:hypothetical protein
MIKIWKYESAPQTLRDLKTFGSSDTWVLQAPVSLSKEIQEFLDRNSAADVEDHRMTDGTIVFFCRAPRRPAYHIRGSGGT